MNIQEEIVDCLYVENADPVKFSSMLIRTRPLDLKLVCGVVMNDIQYKK